MYEACPARAVAGRVHHAPAAAVQFQHFTILEEVIRFGARDRHSDERGKIEHGVAAEPRLGFVDVERKPAETAERAINPRDVIQMRMRQEDGRRPQPVALDPVKHLLRLETAVNDPAGHAFGRRARRHDETVGLVFAKHKRCDDWGSQWGSSE